ncbi:MAG: hypothetical protein FWE08_07735 [Oscillospiraceae bacterium]|nr:hypothetical protein [Oscillospiraceae bacterium]
MEKTRHEEPRLLKIDYVGKSRYLYHEFGDITDKLDDMLKRYNALNELLREGLTQAAAEQVLLKQIVQQAQKTLMEADDM